MIRPNCFERQEIRSVELGVCPMQHFYIWSRDVNPVQNPLLCTQFHKNPMIFHFFFLYACHELQLVRHETASSSAECSRDKPPFSFVRGQDSTTWDIVWVFVTVSARREFHYLHSWLHWLVTTLTYLSCCTVEFIVWVPHLFLDSMSVWNFRDSRDLGKEQ